MIFLNTALAASPRYRQTEEPPASTYDVDFQAKIDFANANSIPVPPESILEYYNQRVLDYKATGAWVKDDAVFDFTGDADTFIPFRLIDIKRRVLATAFGSLVWSSSGAKGNGANAYIDTGFNGRNGVNYQLNDASIGFSLFDIGTKGSKAVIGAAVVASEYTLLVPNNSADSNFMLNTNGLFDFNSVWAKTGYIQVDRISATQMQLDGSNIYNTNSGGIPDLPLAIFGRASTTGADLFSDAGVSFVRFGASSPEKYSSINTVV